MLGWVFNRRILLLPIAAAEPARDRSFGPLVKAFVLHLIVTLSCRVKIVNNRNSIVNLSILLSSLVDPSKLLENIATVSHILRLANRIISSCVPPLLWLGFFVAEQVPYLINIFLDALRYKALYILCDIVEVVLTRLWLLVHLILKPLLQVSIAPRLLLVLCVVEVLILPDDLGYLIPLVSQLGKLQLAQDKFLVILCRAHILRRLVDKITEEITVDSEILDFLY